MAVIRATCATCGDVEVHSRATRLVCTAGSPALGYRCPTCGWERVAAADSAQHAALVAAGVAGFETLEAERSFLHEVEGASRGSVRRCELDDALKALADASTPADLFATS